MRISLPNPTFTYAGMAMPAKVITFGLISGGAQGISVQGEMKLRVAKEFHTHLGLAISELEKKP